MTGPRRIAFATGSCLLCALCAAGLAFASEVKFGSHDVRSLFHISKSQNRNQVHYALRLDEACMPVGAEPVFAYWREMEAGPKKLSALLDREQAAYGIAPGQTVYPSSSRPRVRFQLRAVPERTLIAQVRAEGSRCMASVRTSIQGRAATLKSVHLVLGFFWTIQQIVIEGRATDDGARLRETIEE